MNKSKDIKNNYLRKYIFKFLKDIHRHDKKFYDLVCLENKFDINVELVNKIEEIINEIKVFGNITRKYYYPLCQCILYGIMKNELLFISMNSNALIKNKTVLRDKPQYIQIKKINKILLDIQKKNFPFEQKFYNYARINKLPIIFCGQKY